MRTLIAVQPVRFMARKGKKATKRGAKRSGGVPRAMRAPGGGHALVHAVCSVTDPFCEVAKSARFPDGTATKTMGIQSQQYIQLLTNNVGSCAMAVCPAAPYTWTAVPPGAGLTSGTFPTSYAENSSGLASWMAANVQQWRLVSFGIQVTPMSNPMNLSGTIIMQEAADQAMLGTSYNTAITSTTSFGSSSEVSIMPFAANKPMSWIARPGGPSSRTFQNVGTATSDSSYDWSRVWVFINGAQASSYVALVRIVANYECVLTPGLITSQLATRAPPQNGAVTAATQAVYASVGGITNGAASEVERRVKTAASSVLQGFGQYLAGAAMRTGARLLGGYIAGPAGAAAAGMLTNGVPDVD